MLQNTSTKEEGENEKILQIKLNEIKKSLLKDNSHFEDLLEVHNSKRTVTFDILKNIFEELSNYFKFDLKPLYDYISMKESNYYKK